MVDSFLDALKKVALAGVGAAAYVGEKAGDVVDQLVKKGELTVEQGKAVSDELTQKLREKEEEAKAAAKGEMLDGLKNLSPEERRAIRSKLDEIDTAEKDDTPQA